MAFTKENYPCHKDKALYNLFQRGTNSQAVMCREFQEKRILLAKSTKFGMRRVSEYTLLHVTLLMFMMNLANPSTGINNEVKQMWLMIDLYTENGRNPMLMVKDQSLLLYGSHSYNTLHTTLTNN